MLKRRQFLATAAAALASPMVLKRANAQEPEVTLKLHHFLGPKAPAHSKMLEPWAEAHQDDSGGRDQDRDLPLDVARRRAAPAVPPGCRRRRRHRLDGERLHGRLVSRVPRFSSCRPSLPTTSPRPTSPCAIFSTSHLADRVQGCARPVPACSCRSGDPDGERTGALADDTKGKKLRVPGPTGNAVVEAMGATPVTMPVPDLPQALSTNAVDGALIPWEIIPALKLQDTTKYQIEGPDMNRFGTTTFQVSMNKARWESLPGRPEGGLRQAQRRGLAEGNRRNMARGRRSRHQGCRRGRQ